MKMKKRVVITGGTGFIGSALAAEFTVRDYHVVSTVHGEAPNQTPKDGVTLVSWDGISSDTLLPYVNGADIVINLAGETITGTWTKEKKEAILRSRLDVGSAVSKAIKDSSKRPKVLIQGSATGAYGDTGDRIADENAPYGETYLSHVCAQWEASTESVDKLKVRRCIIRIAPVLGRGGYLATREKPFKWFLGGPVGSGEQWVTSVHLTDVVMAIVFLVENQKARGIYNACMPASVRERE